MAFEFIAEQLQEQKNKARYRRLVCVEDCDAMKIKVDGKQYINFSSNDYLGLSQHAQIKQALQEGVDRFGSSASASSLITGNHFAHEALQATVCEWLNKPRCVLFSSGFAANVGTIQALGQNSVNLWLDKLSHASLIDGAYSSNANVKRFQHNNTDHLSQLLSKSYLHNPEVKSNLIVSEGVFSMDGNQAKWQEIKQCADQHNAWLYSDDAHSIGVIGKSGEGSISKCNIDIVMATFGKALASSGAFLACNNDVADYLTNFSRHYIYSTGISPAIAWATKKSIEIVQQDHWRREKITELSELFAHLLDKNIQLIPTESSIHGIVLGSEEKTLQVSEKLKNAGFWVSAIRPPTVSNNSSRLRVTISSLHKSIEIKALAQCINEAAQT